MMNEQSYNLTDWLKQIKSNEHYEGVKRYIDERGFQEVNHKNATVNVFTAEMALFLVSSKVQCKTHPQGEDVTIDGTKYLDSFVKSYDTGKLEFATIQTGSFSELKNPSSEFVQYYKEQYFETGCNSLWGWDFVEKSFPYILNHGGISQHGKYSGCVSAFKSFLRLHPRLENAIFYEEPKEPSNKADLTHCQMALLAHYTAVPIYDPQNKDSFTARDFLEKHKRIGNPTATIQFYKRYYNKLRSHEKRCDFKQTDSLLKDLHKVEPLLVEDVVALKLLYRDKVEILRRSGDLTLCKEAKAFLERF
jgi:hypothetical protein